MRVLVGKKKYIFLGFLTLVVGFLASGVFAANNFVLNSGNSVNLGAGAQRVEPCDNDVNISAITFNDGNNVYLQGFQYDNADKPACVGYDFETRFVSNAGNQVNLFATTSIASEPNLVRIFAPNSSATWQLGLGAVPTLEATVTQISASSFKVIFTTPISVASDIGKIVMAEIGHLPTGIFNNGYYELGSTSSFWYGSCITSNSTVFYGLSNTTGLYKSAQIPRNTTNFSGLSLSLVNGNGNSIPTTGVAWYGLACSSNGQYIAISGNSNNLWYSKDFGATWDSHTVTSYMPASGGYNTGLSMSSDGQIVALNNNDYFNFWTGGRFWNNPTSVANGYVTINGPGQGVAVSGDGSTIYGASYIKGLWKWRTSNLESYSNLASIPGSAGWNSVNNSSYNLGTHIFQVDTSFDGKTVAIASKTNATVYVSRDGFSSASFYSPTNLATTDTQGGTTRNIVPYKASVSESGRFIAIAFEDSSGVYSNNYGTVQSSTDFGTSVTDTAFAHRFMQTITISSDGRLILTGGGGSNTKLVLMGSA